MAAKGEVNPGKITACYSIVCGKCRKWLTSYRLSDVFVAEDLYQAGWLKVKPEGWICPECRIAPPVADQDTER